MLVLLSKHAGSPIPTVFSTNNGLSVMCLDPSFFQQFLTYIAVSARLSLGQMSSFTLSPPLKAEGTSFPAARNQHPRQLLKQPQEVGE